MEVIRGRDGLASFLKRPRFHQLQQAASGGPIIFIVKEAKGDDADA